MTQLPDSFTVTEEDISTGKPISTRTCPLALALRRETGDARYITVGILLTYIDEGLATQEMYLHGPKLAAWIRRFDGGETVPPVTIEWDAIPDTDDTDVAEFKKVIEGRIEITEVRP